MLGLATMSQVERIMKAAIFAVIMTSIILPAVALAASGQQNATTKPQGTDEQRREEVITVSATRLPVRLSDLPFAATTWEARDLERAPAIVIDEALRSSPSVLSLIHI